VFTSSYLPRCGGPHPPVGGKACPPAALAEPLRGTGVGTTTYRGTARVVAASDGELDRLEPGDILVTPFTITSAVRA
jgi:hypothetical protein